VTLRGACALALALVLAMAAAPWAPRAGAAALDLTDAEFRWAVNRHSSGPSHGPGLNFLSAGDISGALTAPNTMITQADWRATSGDVTIEKRTSPSSAATATWAGLQTDQAGTALSRSATRYSGLEMVFGGGEGTVDPAAGTAEIEWEGTASVLFYSGFVYLTISDPVLSVTRSGAKVTATLGGHVSSREDASTWTRMTPRTVTLAQFDRREVELTGESGFSAAPLYRGVAYRNADSSQPQNVSGPDWGSFPESFVDFARDSGSGAFWYSTGTSDSSKIPFPVVVSWNSEDPQESPDTGTGGSNSGGIVGGVVGDTVEDIIRAAGADVAGTAEAWMDEAWKPLQPGAVDAARSGTAEQADTTGTAEQPGSVPALVDDEFARQYGENYSAGDPMTTGTVGATLATAAVSPAGGPSAAAAPAPAPGTAASPSAAPVAAHPPLSEVAYAQTSASSETGNPTHQWQWWVGAALLAIAAVLFVQTVRRKD